MMWRVMKIARHISILDFGFEKRGALKIPDIQTFVQATLYRRRY
jgi:hypothetical protein